MNWKNGRRKNGQMPGQGVPQRKSTPRRARPSTTTRTRSADESDYLKRDALFHADFERLIALMCLFRDSSNEDWNGQLLTRDFARCPGNVKFNAELHDFDLADVRK